MLSSHLGRHDMVQQMLEARRAARSTNHSQVVSEQPKESTEKQQIPNQAVLNLYEQQDYAQMMQVNNDNPEAIYA